MLGRKEQKFKCNADSISVYSYVFVCTEREREREYLCVKKLGLRGYFNLLIIWEKIDPFDKVVRWHFRSMYHALSLI